MVEQTQLTHAAALNQEYRAITQAMHMLDEHAKIIAMMIGSPSADETRQPTGLMIRTDRIEYPPQMVAGIKQQLTARQEVIREELRAMGVTVTVQRAAAKPAAAQPHRA